MTVEQNGMVTDMYNSNSSMDKLRLALQPLAGKLLDQDLSEVDAVYTRLSRAGYNAETIASTFENVNKTISDAWAGVSDFMFKTDEIVDVQMEKLIQSLRVFIEATKFNETEIAKQAANANELAEEILAELKALFDERVIRINQG